MLSFDDLQQIYINYLLRSSRKITSKNDNAETQKEPAAVVVIGSEYALIAAMMLGRTVDKLVVTNRGRQNFALHEQMTVMKERFRQMRGADKLFDEQTLEPVQVAMRRMLAVKLEDDM